MASAWKALIAGDRQVTGSVENILQPAAQMLSRATTSKSLLWKASGNSFLKTNSGQSIIHGICTQAPGEIIVHSAIFNLLWKNATVLRPTLRTLYAKRNLPITRMSAPNSRVLPRGAGLRIKSLFVGC